MPDGDTFGFMLDISRFISCLLMIFVSYMVVGVFFHVDGEKAWLLKQINLYTKQNTNILYKMTE